MRKEKKKYIEERDYKKEKIMLKKGILTQKEKRRLGYEKKSA